MKHLIFGIVCAILFGAIGACACQFIGWEHPRTWGPDGRIMAVLVVGVCAFAGGSLGWAFSMRDNT